jgi:hypothetical protein
LVQAKAWSREAASRSGEKVTAAVASLKASSASSGRLARSRPGAASGTRNGSIILRKRSVRASARAIT